MDIHNQKGIIISPKNHNLTFVYVDFEMVMTKKGIKVDEAGGYYSEGIAQLAAIVEKKDWKPSLIHLLKPIGKEKFFKILKKHNPSILGFSVRTGVRKFSKQLIAWAREFNPDIFILVGSYHPTLWPKKVIRWPGVDAICIGEGEGAVMQLLENIDNRKSIHDIGSLWVKTNSKLKTQDSKVLRNPVQPLVENLDTLPIPKFEIFDFSKLIPSQVKVPVVVLTRGCPYNCTYCWNSFARNLYPNKQHYVRYRSPKNCIKYCKRVIEVYPETRFMRFLDDLWPFWDPNWFNDFSTLYDKEISKPFECNLRANLLDEKIIKRLKEVKCFGIYFGVESGNEYIRNKILKRNMSEEVLLNAFLTAKKYGIRTHSFNIYGLPYENMNRALDTVKLNAKLQPTDMYSPIFFPYAGTELYDIAVKGGFFDPKKKLHPYVNVIMPGFGRNRIRYAALYSKMFIRMYQLVFKLGTVIRRPLEKILDFFWLFPYWPFPICNEVMILYNKSIAGLKTFIKKNFFGLYLRLRPLPTA